MTTNAKVFKLVDECGEETYIAADCEASAWNLLKRSLGCARPFIRFQRFALIQLRSVQS